MASEKPYSVKENFGLFVVSGPGLSYPCPTPEGADRIADLCNIASSAAADEVGRAVEVCRLLHETLTNNPWPMPGTGNWELIEKMAGDVVLFHARTATDASGAMKHKENGNG